MTVKDCFELGVISKLFSFKGEVILHIESKDASLYKNLDSLFIEINGELVPFFVEKIRHHKKNQFRVIFEDVDSEEMAKKIVKKKAFLPLELLPEIDDDRFNSNHIVGFMVTDQDSNEVGEIVNFIDSPKNPLVEVDYKGNLAMIPFNDNTQLKFDKANKTIQINIPEGLLDLYC